jgi:bud site selection protein 31
MPRIRTLNTKKAPEGWDEVAPQLEEFQQQMKDAVNEPHEGKRRSEATWPITKIHYERSRYIYELYYKKKAISKELYDYLLQEKYGDAMLIAKWKKPGYEFLCSLQAIDKKGTNFGTTSMCRVPLHLRRPGPQGPTVNTGCISCASTEAGRLGGPIWWDSPRPADLVGWAKAGCPTEDKPGKKTKGA